MLLAYGVTPEELERRMAVIRTEPAPVVAIAPPPAQSARDTLILTPAKSVTASSPGGAAAVVSPEVRVVLTQALQATSSIWQNPIVKWGAIAGGLLLFGLALTRPRGP